MENLNRRTGKTTRLANKAIDFFFKNGFVYIPTDEDVQNNYENVPKKYLKSAKKFTDVGGQMVLLYKMKCRFDGEFKVLNINTNNNLFIFNYDGKS